MPIGAPAGVHFRLPLRVAEVLPAQTENRHCRQDVEASAQDAASDALCPVRVRDVTVRVSFDDGVSWKSVPVKREGRRWIAE